MRVLVTGGGGFIGSHVTAELLRNDHIPVVMDLSHGGNVTDQESWAKMPECDAVIHLAGVLGTAELFDDPYTAIDVNIKGAVRALEYCTQTGARLVQITMPDCWENVYQATKHCANKLATAWHRAFGVPVVSVRAFNVYGQGQQHGPGHPQKIIPTFATAAWEGKPIPIWGDGSQYVDLISADDVASVLVQALESPGKDEVIDAGTGQGHTVMQVAHMVWNIARPGEPLLTQFLPMRQGETDTFGRATIAALHGWNHLTRKPEWNEAHFADVVRWYKDYGSRR